MACSVPELTTWLQQRKLKTALLLQHLERANTRRTGSIRTENSGWAIGSISNCSTTSKPLSLTNKNGNAPVGTAVLPGGAGPASRAPLRLPPRASRGRTRPVSRLVPCTPPVPRTPAHASRRTSPVLLSPAPHQLASIGRQQVNEHMLKQYVLCVSDVR